MHKTAQALLQRLSKPGHPWSSLLRALERSQTQENRPALYLCCTVSAIPLRTAASRAAAAITSLTSAPGISMEVLEMGRHEGGQVHLWTRPNSAIAFVAASDRCCFRMSSRRTLMHHSLLCCRENPNWHKHPNDRAVPSSFVKYWGERK